jgi:hypothetical protein
LFLLLFFCGKDEPLDFGLWTLDFGIFGFCVLISGGDNNAAYGLCFTLGQSLYDDVNKKYG